MAGGHETEVQQTQRRPAADVRAAALDRLGGRIFRAIYSVRLRLRLLRLAFMRRDRIPDLVVMAIEATE